MGLRGYLDLARLQTAGVTATVPVYGYIAAHAVGGAGLPDLAADPVVVPLLAIGFCAHVFGFVHNEIADRATDARAGTQRPKPLPAGEASVAGAWALVLGGLVVALAIAGWLGSAADSSLLVLTAASFLLAGCYNVFGKSFAGGDVLLALSIFVFVIAGAGAVESYGALTDPAVLLLAGLSACVLFFNNAFEGGFKDHVTDALGGKKTLVLALRARGEKYSSPDGLVVLAHWPVHGLMLALAVGLSLGPLATGEMRWDLGRVGLAAGLILLMGRFFVRGVGQTDRKKMLTFFSLHEFMAVVLLIVTIAPFLGLAHFLVLFLAPLGWYVAYNRLVYGTAGAPNV
jgi:4-hydroxybenzoate polyprenyltransferase